MFMYDQLSSSISLCITSNMDVSYHVQLFLISVIGVIYQNIDVNVF